jgi:hypothetical protein
VETLDVAATSVAVAPPLSRDRRVMAATPSHEPDVGRWPVWARLAILIGGSAALWAGLGWVALRILKMG